jgi:hypothetical protein
VFHFSASIASSGAVARVDHLTIDERENLNVCFCLFL